jgi:hypothetical protein
MDDVMKQSIQQKRLDMILSAILILFLLLAFLYRSSPIDFLNPGFPILKPGDLELAEKFQIPEGHPQPKRITNIHDGSEITYELVFHVEDTSQVFPDGDGGMTTTGFSVFLFVTRFPNSNEAEKALQELYIKYEEMEGDFPLRITNIPLESFTSKADDHLLWCNQYSRELMFNAEEVHACYYWAVYDRYLSRTRLSMWPIVGAGRQFSLELFSELINHAENEFLSKAGRQK